MNDEQTVTDEALEAQIEDLEAQIDCIETQIQTYPMKGTDRC